MYNNHSIDCDWQFEQYPNECNCGAVIGKLGEQVVDKQLFLAMFAVLVYKESVFKQYAEMHSAKQTPESLEKARRNQEHADDIHRVIKAAMDQPRDSSGQ